MDEQPLGCRAEKNIARLSRGWPRLLDLHLAAEYLSVGKPTVRDWVAAEILRPVKLPGSTLRDRGGQVITPAGKRKMNKLLFDRADLDVFIEQCKSQESA